MMENLLLGLVVMVACLLVQALLVVVAIRFYVRNRDVVDSPTFAGTLGMISAVMVVLVLGNFVQIGIWAQLFVALGEFEDYGTALYHSAVNFATLGYGDIVMSEERRILGPMQSINGVLMVGVSTAVMMSALQDALKLTQQARQRN
jgi:voltage-gated potassium channel Kch